MRAARGDAEERRGEALDLDEAAARAHDAEVLAVQAVEAGEDAGRERRVDGRLERRAWSTPKPAGQGIAATVSGCT